MRNDRLVRLFKNLSKNDKAFEIEKYIKAIKDSEKLDHLGLELLDIKNLDELKSRLTQLNPIKSSK